MDLQISGFLRSFFFTPASLNNFLYSFFIDLMSIKPVFLSMDKGVLEKYLKVFMNNGDDYNFFICNFSIPYTNF